MLILTLNVMQNVKKNFDSLKADADNYKPMKASMTEWELDEVAFWHSFLLLRGNSKSLKKPHLWFGFKQCCCSQKPPPRLAKRAEGEERD